MAATRWTLCIALAAAACGGNGGNNNNQPDASTADATQNGGGGGTCAEPIDLVARATPEGAGLVFRGSTAGRPNALHPYGGCAAMDAEEAVFSYRVPAGVGAVRASTAGSAFDTVVYARDACSQNATGADRSCADNLRDGTLQSEIFLSGLMENEVIYLVVDGTSAGEGGASSGEFVLTVTPVEPGTMGNPCRPASEPQTEPRCNAPLGCSEGGAADYSAICVPTVANGMPCDGTGSANTCVSPARCAQDPSPPMGMEPTAACALPGTRAGADCRPATESSRCDAPLACGAGDYPVCVRVLAPGEACDPSGTYNRCPEGQTCRAVGDAGAANCS